MNKEFDEGAAQLRVVLRQRPQCRYPSRLDAAWVAWQCLRWPTHVAIANTASDLTPCNAHLNEVARGVMAGVWEAGGIPLELTVISLVIALTKSLGKELATSGFS